MRDITLCEIHSLYDFTVEREHFYWVEDEVGHQIVLQRCLPKLRNPWIHEKGDFDYVTKILSFRWGDDSGLSGFKIPKIPLENRASPVSEKGDAMKEDVKGDEALRKDAL